MRTLSATLTTNQKAGIRPPLCKLVLTKSGQTTQTYDISSTTNRILGLSHIEQEWSQIGNVSVHSDATLAALDLEGYTGTISYGYNDGTQGDEYSACAPLEVVAQRSSTLLSGRQAQLITFFTLAGIIDLMSAEKASARYTQEDTDTQTVKTLLTKIAEATLAPFTNCKAYTITFDSEDSLIDSYKPADYFRVSMGESRLSAFKKLIQTTKCKARIEDDGQIHVFNPTISGTSYDYEYNDAVTNHNFFEKGTRKRLVFPNRIIVSSHPDQGNYTGNAVDSATYTALGNRYIDKTIYIRATSNTQCTNIATAILQHLQVAAEKGHGLVPMNCGQEVMDYIKFTDSIASDTRTGNVGYLHRQYSPERRFSTELRFGKVAGELPFMSAIDPTTGRVTGGVTGGVTLDDLHALRAYVNEKDDGLLDLILGLPVGVETNDGIFTNLEVTERLIIPEW